VARLPWFRVYTEIVDDPKMARLSGDQFRDWIFLLALARESEEPGVIMMSPEDAAWRLRRPPDEFKESLSLFERLEMITLEDGRIVVSKFLERQYDKPSDRPDEVRRRVARHRKRQSNAAATPDPVDGNAAVTRRNAIDSESDSDSEGEEGLLPPPKLPEMTPAEREILHLLKTTKNYPFQLEKDLEFIREMAVEHPNLDLVDQVRRWRTRKNYDEPLTKRSRPHSQLANWLRKAEEYGQQRQARDGPERPQLRDMTDEATEFVSHIYGKGDRREQAASE